MAGSSISFVIFSSICPHLGCRFNWKHRDRTASSAPATARSSASAKARNSRARTARPRSAALPRKSGAAQVTWIQYKSGTPDRVIVAYS
jgi:hypothetical protein